MQQSVVLTVCVIPSNKNKDVNEWRGREGSGRIGNCTKLFINLETPNL